MFYEQPDREFTPTSHSELKDNYTRILEHTSEKTRKNYFKRFKSAFNKIKKNQNKTKEPFEISFYNEVSSIEDKRSSGKLKQASVRQYKAAYLYGLTLVSEYQVDSEKLKYELDPEDFAIIDEMSHELSLPFIETIYDRINSWYSEDAATAKALDNKAHLQSNTSARKAKLFDKDLYQHIMLNADQRYVVLQMFIRLNVKLGLRPNEWYSAIILPNEHFEHLVNEDIDTKSVPSYGLNSTLSESDKKLIKQSRYLLSSLYPDIKKEYSNKENGTPVLVVKNSKNTHGRANGEYRYILLDGMSKKDLQLLPILITKLHEKHHESVPEPSKRDAYSFDRHVMQSLQNSFKYFLDNDPTCQEIIENSYKRKLSTYKYEKSRAIKDGKPWSRKKPIKEYPTLYSTRHQAVSDAKASGASSIIMAALFGHASVMTADRHYGRLADSWGSGMLKPHQESINKVIVGLTDNQLEASLSEISHEDLVNAYKELVSNEQEPIQKDIADVVSQKAADNKFKEALSYIVNKDSSIHERLVKPMSKIATSSSSSSSSGVLKTKSLKARLK